MNRNQGTAAVFLAGNVLLLGSIVWTAWIVRDGFSWWSVGTGCLAFVGFCVAATPLCQFNESAGALYTLGVMCLGCLAWLVLLVRDGFSWWSLLPGAVGAFILLLLCSQLHKDYWPRIEGWFDAQRLSRHRQRADQLLNTADPQLIPSLLEMALDRQYEVRNMAVAHLEHLDSSWISSESVQQALPSFMDALLDYRRADSAQKILAIMSPQWPRLSAAQRLVPRAIQMLAHQEWYVRSCALNYLACVPSPEAVGPLIQVLSGNSSGSRDVAARALGEIGDSRAVMPLMCARLDEDSTAVCNAAEAALVKLNDPRGLELLGALSRTWDSDGEAEYWRAKLGLPPSKARQARLHEDSARMAVAADRETKRRQIMERLMPRQVAEECAQLRSLLSAASADFVSHESVSASEAAKQHEAHLRTQQDLIRQLEGKEAPYRAAADEQMRNM